MQWPKKWRLALSVCIFDSNRHSSVSPSGGNWQGAYLRADQIQTSPDLPTTFMLYCYSSTGSMWNDGNFEYVDGF